MASKEKKQEEENADKKEAPAEAKEQKPHKKEAKEAHKEAPKHDIRGTKKGIVRIAGKDMGGDTRLKNAVLRIRGIGHSLRNAVTRLIEKKLGISPEVQIGDLSDEQIANIDKVLFGITSNDLPKFLLNRQSDPSTGESKQMIMNDLAFVLRQDLEGKKKNRTWQGFRALKGKKVRGQRTRNTGRKGLTMGVMREKLKPGQLPEEEGGRGARQRASSSGAAPAAPAAAAPAAEKKPAEKK
jgi:small subunit ribosomal protein S13